MAARRERSEIWQKTIRMYKFGIVTNACHIESKEDV